MGIETYLTVAFWLGLIGIITRALCLCFVDYPRSKKISVGQDVTSLIIVIAFFVWVCVLRSE